MPEIIDKPYNPMYSTDLDELNRQVFDEHNAYMREKSRADGMRKKLSKYIELELEGIEDIITFITDECTNKAIQERISRIRDILSEH